MNEPKSIWKKSWKGNGAIFILSLLISLTVFLVALIYALANWEKPVADTFTTAALVGIGFVAGCLFIIYVAFPLSRWLFWKHWRRTFFALACFATLIALFYAEEDWRGKHDWEKFKREWEAKGERFDWQSVVPPRVPDDQNFAMQPIWVDSIKFEYGSNVCKQWYGETMTEAERTNLVDRLNLSIYGNEDWKNAPTNGNWARGTETDLGGWQNYYRVLATKTNEFPVPLQPQTPAADVLLALSKFDPAIEELRQASRLPYSRFPLNYENQPPAAILLPHLAVLKRCAQVLQLRAIAELQNGQGDKALADIKLLLHLTDSARTEPFLISHLVRIAMLEYTLQPIYEGLAEHKWSDTQLADLDSELAKLDFLTDFESAMRGERAMEIANIEFLRHPPRNPEFHRPRLYFLAPFFSLVHELYNISDEGDGNSQMGFQTLALGFGPSGWLVQNELRIAQFETKWYLPIVDEKTQTISPDKARVPDSALDQEIRHRTPENLLERLFMPSFGSAAKRFAYAQSSTDLARVAIALERCRLAYGEYPKSLDALGSQFSEGIPHDIIGGQPLNYRRTSDGQFVLYSVGWNETDDDGVVGLTKSGAPDINRGDWVWRYPQK
jgi:hypothetical protein